MDRPRANPHPGLGDHAEDPLGADQHPVGARAGARAGQPAALPDAARRDRAHRLDQVVDVGQLGREVPARPGRDPAAERRVLERLREVAQGQPVLGELVLERRDRAPRPGSGPRSRPGRPRAPGRARRGRPRPSRSRSRRSAARPRRRRWSRRRRGSPPRPPPRTSRAPPRAPPRRAGGRPGRAGSRLAADPANDVAVGLAERVRDPVVGRAREDRREHLGRCQPRLRQLDRVERDRLLRHHPEAEPRADLAGGALEVGGCGLLVLVAPAPVLAAPPHGSGYQ